MLPSSDVGIGNTQGSAELLRRDHEPISHLFCANSGLERL